MSDTPTSGRLGNDLRALRRSRSDRMVAGVLGGLAGRLGVDPLVLRIATVVLALFGGVGIALYAVAWLLIPAEDTERSVAEQALGRGSNQSPSMATVCLAVGLAIVALMATGGSFGSGVGPVLLVLAVVGAVLLLRKHDDEGEPADGWPAGDGEPSALEPDIGWPDVGREPTSGSPDDDGEPAEDPADERPSSPDDEGPPAATPISQVSYVGSGWPEGPDWNAWEPADPEVDMAERLRDEPAPPKSWSALGPLTVSVLVVTLGLLAIVDASWVTFPPSVYVITGLAIAGAGLLIGTWFGRSRGLIALGVVLTMALVPAVFLSQFSWDVGDYHISPTSVDAVPTGTLEHGAASVVLDLSEVPFDDGDEIDLTVEQALGELRVLLPPDVDADVTAEAGLGDVEVFGVSSDGAGVTHGTTDVGEDGAGGGAITLDLEVGLGEIQVERVSQ